VLPYNRLEVYSEGRVAFCGVQVKKYLVHWTGLCLGLLRWVSWGPGAAAGTENNRLPMQQH